MSEENKTSPGGEGDTTAQPTQVTSAWKPIVLFAVPLVLLIIYEGFLRK